MLAPGHSLMDWIRLGKSGKDLAGTGGKLLDVTLDELAKHNRVDDAWTGLRGNVYNITQYMDYHPGGVEELMRGAGIDCTVLFDEVHKWVNYESMLSKCLVGKLVSTSAATTPTVMRKGPRGSLLGSVGNLQPAQLHATNGIQPADAKAVEKTETFLVPGIRGIMSQPRYDWFQSDSSVTINIYTRSAVVKCHENVLVELDDGRRLHVRVLVGDHTFHVNTVLEAEVAADYKVSVSRTNGRVEIVMPKVEIGRHWSQLCQTTVGEDSGLWRKTADEEISFWSCHISSVETVTHDTNLYCVDLPHGAHMCVPVGRHIFVTACVAGTNIVHAYTVIPPSLVGDHSVERKVRDGRCLCMMIKIYHSGVLTPLVGQLRPGDCIQISKSYGGDFDTSRLDGISQLFLYAAGTGFTPMAAILAHCLHESKENPQRSKCEILLMFFNKTVSDILWRNQLDQLASTVDWFKVHYVLSEPDPTWNGLTGFLTQDLFTPYVPRLDASEPATPTDSRRLLCACGPLPFSNEVVRLGKLHNYTSDMIHVFAG
jgi:cytochrome-b5 reductase